MLFLRPNRAFLLHSIPQQALYRTCADRTLKQRIILKHPDFFNTFLKKRDAAFDVNTLDPERDKELKSRCKNKPPAISNTLALIIWVAFGALFCNLAANIPEPKSESVFDRLHLID